MLVLISFDIRDGRRAGEEGKDRDIGGNSSSREGLGRNAPDGVVSSEANPLRNRAVLLLGLGQLLLGTERLVALRKRVNGLVMSSRCYVFPVSSSSAILSACAVNAISFHVGGKSPFYSER